MKKLVITAVLLALLGLGYWQLSRMKLAVPGAAGKLDKIIRDDLIIPIKATGEVRPNARQEVKSEASGEILEIAKNAGDPVKAGDLIIRLASDDEERSVKRSELELRRAEATLEKAKVAVAESAVKVTSAEAQMESVLPRIEQAEFELNRVEELRKSDATYDDEEIRAKTTHKGLLADQKSAGAGLESAKNGVKLAEQDLITAQANYDVAQQNLADARERLRETAIMAKTDGMVTQLNVEIGDVIQSGKSVVGGGTILAVISDVSKLLVRTDVQESDIGEILALAPPEARPKMLESAGGHTVALAADSDKDSSDVKMTVESFGNEVFVGVIERIYPEPKKLNSVVTYLVDIRMTSENRHKLMLGMQAEVDFVVTNMKDALLVRQGCVRTHSDGRLGIYLPQERRDGEEVPKPRFVECKFGSGNGVYVPILEGEGLSEGTLVYLDLPRQVGDEDEEE